MNNYFMIKIFRKECMNSLKSVGLLTMINLTFFFTFILYFRDWNADKISFYKSINTSLWSALIFYFFFNVFGGSEAKSIKLISLKKKIEFNIKRLDHLHNSIIKELEGLNLYSSNLKSFFDLCDKIPSNHIPIFSNLRMATFSSTGIVYLNTSQILESNFKSFISNYEELEKFSLALQIHEFDPLLYEKIYKMTLTTPNGSMFLRMRQADSHKVLGTDIDMVCNSFKKVIEHLNNDWFMDIELNKTFLS